MTMRVVVAAAIGGLLSGGVAGAQPVPASQPEAVAARYLDPVEGLPLDRAISVALEVEPSLRAARREVEAAQGMRTQAALKPNPMFSFSQLEEPYGSDRQTRVEFVWPLDLFRKAGRIAVADQEIVATRHGVADRERALAADVRRTYGEVATTLRELSVLDDLVVATTRQETLVAARVDQGATPPLERDILRVELRRLASERLLLLGAIEQSLLELKRLLGMAAEAPLKIRETLEQLVQRDTALPPKEPAANVVDTRPDVAAAQAQLQVADARIDRARRDKRMDIDVFGMYMRMEANFPQQGIGTGNTLVPIEGLFHYVSAGMSITLPWRDRNQGEIAAAQAQRAGAALELDAARLAAQAEIAAARTRDTHARQAAAVYTLEARALARQNLTVVGQTYELGRATVFDVLAEQRRFLEVERAFTGALREAYQARQVLRRALGEL